MLTGKFSQLDVRVLDDDELFMLTKNCRYTHGSFEYTVPAGFITDFASIPRLLRGIFKRNGKSRKPSVFHDHMVRNNWKTRECADRMFKQMLLDVGMSKWRAQIYFIGVTIGRWFNA